MIPGTTGVTAVEEGTFTEISEKMILNLTLKVLQNRQVRILEHLLEECERD
jgi:hypothetical protein